MIPLTGELLGVSFDDLREENWPIPQCSIQNRNVYFSVLSEALLDMGQVHCGICETERLYMATQVTSVWRD